MSKLEQILSAVTPADPATAMDLARRRWDAVAKPLHGLGRLEDLLVRAAGGAGTPELDFSKKALAVFCADNGVVAQGVAQTGQEVTAAVAQAMGEGRSSVCRMAKTAGAAVVPVDVGMAPHPPTRYLRVPQRHERNLGHHPGSGYGAGDGGDGPPDGLWPGGGAVPIRLPPAGRRGDGNRQHHHRGGGGLRPAGPGPGYGGGPGGRPVRRGPGPEAAGHPDRPGGKPAGPERPAGHFV